VIADRSRHRKAPYVRLIHQDFTKPLPVREASFDLLFALQAPGVARATARYLRVGGLLVMDNHRGCRRCNEEGDLNLIGSGRARRTVVDLSFEAPDARPAQTGSPPRRPGVPDHCVFERNCDHASR